MDNECLNRDFLSKWSLQLCPSRGIKDTKSKWDVSLQHARYIGLLAVSIYLRLDIYLLRFYCEAAAFTLTTFMPVSLISHFKTIVTRNECY